MDGWAATKAIRALPGCTSDALVIVGMSAQGGAVTSGRWKETGMDGFMAKPFGLAKLVEMVRSRGLQRRGLRGGSPRGVVVEGVEQAREV